VLDRLLTWLSQWTAAGLEYHLWRPANWDLALRTLWKKPEGGTP
jgi:hypothetical protein